MMKLSRWFPVAMTVALVALAPAAEAQTVQPTFPGPELRAYVLVGGAAYDLDPLNQALTGGGFGELDDNLFSLGGGGHVLLSRWLLGGEGFGIIRRSTDTAAADWRARVMGGGGVLNLGYAIIRTGGTSVYPMIGVGAGAFSLEMTERTQPTFDEVLAKPGRISTLTQLTMLVQPALGLDHLVPLATIDGVATGLVLGVRAGYTFSPVTSDWYLEATRVPGGPAQGMEGAFVRVTVGAGARFLPRR